MASKKFEIKAEIKFPSKLELKQSGADVATATKAFQTGALRASGQVESGLKTALDEAIDSPVWGPFSPKTPYTGRGGAVKGPGTRNIIDTGALKNSLSIKTKFLQTKVNTHVSYSAPYARFVHYGGVIQPYGNRNANSVLIPARPWVESVMRGGGPVPQYDYRRVYQSEIEAAWVE